MKITQDEMNKKYEELEKSGKSQNGGTENPHSPLKTDLIQEPLTYSKVEEKVLELIPSSQIALKLILAVTASSVYPNSVMLWLLFVGVPSSGKTNMVRLVKDADCAYYLDNLTQNAFISGERETKTNKVHDLLPQLHKKCLIIKDWTSIFSLDEKMTRKILGDLVGIYDEEFTKFSSARGRITYDSSFSQLGCITPATLNKHTQYMNMVGPRFLCYTLPSTSPENQNISYKNIFSDRDRSVTEREARRHVSSYITQIVNKEVVVSSLSDEVQGYLRLGAELMSNCRGIVVIQSASYTNEQAEKIQYYEVSGVQIEEPWRAIQQLIALSRMLAHVVGNTEVGVNEMVIIKDVVISSMPADRSQALRMIMSKGGTVTAKELADLSDKSHKTSRRLLDELTALKVLEKNKGVDQEANEYVIVNKFRAFLLLGTAEFLSLRTLIDLVQ